jgi:hypothetical protein
VRHHVRLIDGFIHVKILIEEPGIARIVDARHRAPHLEHRPREVTQDEIGGIVIGAGDKYIRLFETGMPKYGRVGRLSFKNDLGRQFMVQMGQQFTAVFHEPDLIILSEQLGGELGSSAAAPGNKYEHATPPSLPAVFRARLSHLRALR